MYLLSFPEIQFFDEWQIAEIPKAQDKQGVDKVDSYVQWYNLAQCHVSRPMKTNQKKFNLRLTLESAKIISFKILDFIMTLRFFFFWIRLWKLVQELDPRKVCSQLKTVKAVIFHFKSIRSIMNTDFFVNRKWIWLIKFRN